MLAHRSHCRNARPSSVTAVTADRRMGGRDADPYRSSGSPRSISTASTCVSTFGNAMATSFRSRTPITRSFGLAVEVPVDVEMKGWSMTSLSVFIGS